MKGTLFLNLKSGVKLSPLETQALVAAAGDAGLDVIELSPDVDVGQTVRAHLARGTRLFLAAGGDGTVHHVMQSLVHTDACLGVLPIGTYNNFARDLGIPIGWRAALEVALDGERRQVDTGRVNDRFFLNNVSIGLYPELVARREERGRDYPRWKARLYAAYTTLRKYRHVTMTVETEHHREAIRTHVFIVSNNTYDLSRIGIMRAPRSLLDEGRLSVYWLPHTPRVQLMKVVARYLAGRVREVPFRSFRTLRMRVQSSRDHLHVGLDGEVFTMQTPLVITIVPQSLLVKAPRMGGVPAG
ncbi:MAG TPA: diacylglycerol kinase family protein [Thermoanaerobaculia bacterium]|nr:diacylglycerol kinase family protein [Thermoanaerobaculia bacterium]